MKLVRCAWCGCQFAKTVGETNRARRIGAPIYCGREHAGLARQSGKTSAQKKEEKRLYDAQYRKDNAEWIRDRKAAYHKRKYDPAEAAVERKKRMPRHVEYCRRPEYRAWKRDYDKQYLAKRDYGRFWEAAILANDLNRTIKQKASNYEIDLENGTLGKAQRRKRDAAIECPRA